MSSLLLAAAAAVAPICADRPAKANAVCTVPAGRFQAEVGATDWTRITEGGDTVDALTLGSSLLKIGIDDRSDFELNVMPYIKIKSGEGTASGFGDMIARYKHRLTAGDAPVQFAILPFVKLPTAKRSIGNGRMEGGLAVPLSFSLAGPISATLGPEVDILTDFDGHGRHAAVVNVVNISATIGRYSVAGELWSNFNFDPARTVTQVSLDAAVAYTLTNDVQFDSGINLGLTKATPDTEIYFGVSIRH